MTNKVISVTSAAISEMKISASPLDKECFFPHAKRTQAHATFKSYRGLPKELLRRTRKNTHVCLFCALKLAVGAVGVLKTRAGK